MRGKAGWVLVAACAVFWWGRLPAVAATESAGPACLRVPIGSTGTCLTLSWYVGLRRAIEERDVEFGLRFTFSWAPQGRSAVAELPLPEASREGGAAASGKFMARAESLVGTLAAYGMLAPGGGLERFVRDAGE